MPQTPCWDVVYNSFESYITYNKIFVMLQSSTRGMWATSPNRELFKLLPHVRRKRQPWLEKGAAAARARKAG